MPVLLQIPENPNCDAMDAQVFQCRSAARTVTHILCERSAGLEWCPVTGIDEGGVPCPATACIVEDSGDGACYLVIGGGVGTATAAAGHCRRVESRGPGAVGRAVFPAVGRWGVRFGLSDWAAGLAPL